MNITKLVIGFVNEPVLAIMKYKHLCLYMWLRLPVFVSLSICFGLFFQSCNVTAPPTFLSSIQKDTMVSANKLELPQLVISNNDVLGITVNSLNKELDAKFNTIVTPSTGNTGILVQDPGYKVNANGFINFHYIGLVKAAGLTREQFKDKLEKELSPYLKEPIVVVKFLNKKITVIGAVSKPQILFMTDEQISIWDAIVMSGDFTDDADFKNVFVIRDTANQKQVKKIDLENLKFSSSSWATLLPDDVLYIKKNKARTWKDESQRRVQTNLSIVTTAVSMVVLLLTFFKN